MGANTSHRVIRCKWFSISRGSFTARVWVPELNAVTNIVKTARRGIWRSRGLYAGGPPGNLDPWRDIARGHRGKLHGGRLDLRIP